MMSTETVAMALGAPQDVAQAIEKICAELRISSELEKSHFIGQMTVESQNFTKVEENLNYSHKRMAQVWPARYAANPNAPLEQRVPNQRALSINSPKALANDTYNGRMDNRVGSDDGWNFRGRGFKMITGHANYLAYSMWAYGDDRVVRNPDMLRQLPDSVRSGGWFWVRNNLGPYARENNVLVVSRGINIGDVNSKATPLGLAEREAATKRAQAEFARLRAT